MRKIILASLIILTFVSICVFIPVIEEIDNRYVAFIYDENDLEMNVYAHRHPEMLGVNDDGKQVIWVYSPEYYDAIQSIIRISPIELRFNFTQP